MQYFLNQLDNFHIKFCLVVDDETKFCTFTEAFQLSCHGLYEACFGKGIML